MKIDGLDIMDLIPEAQARALRKGLNVGSLNFDDLIKLVRIDHYSGQKWEDLEPSEWCQYQGYFYPDDHPIITDPNY